MGPKHRDLPVGMRFRPTDYECANYFLKKKVLGQPMKALTQPEECDDIFSRHPRDLPGYPGEEHWYFYCKHNNQVNTPSHNLWIPTGEETDVLDPKNNDDLVGIKRSFAFIENEEESDNNYMSDEEEPPTYNWFMDEISLPLTVFDTDLVLCHIFGKKIKPEVVNLPIIELESNESEEDKDEKEESVDNKPAETFNLVRRKDGTVIPPPPASP